MWTPAVISVLALLPFCAPSSTSFEASSPAPPQFPLQFEADLEITAHLLDATVAYPPSLRKMKIRYDYTQGLARADILAGYDKGKSYIRRYDTALRRSKSTRSSTANTPTANAPTLAKPCHDRNYLKSWCTRETRTFWAKSVSCGHTASLTRCFASMCTTASKATRRFD
ncbi:hypothetical protein, variant [Aphanomyces astaci]|uniref:Uncharacterized protein n=1 Tax=Aphanomyces astaci TaxID=112090 RepID=W4FMV3_APHAT|nr:hypothetical protein, variant [Aphanomyces astaci]ETV68144.1 hypothetical protein, variant [Aphanomyces astaci]|eukprot:XP_009842443.1 hypothetical protein, variant [Aphanomyces astaci]